MKNNKGITLIALTITIIILIILASVGTYSGLQALRDSKEDAQIAEVGMVQQAILENYTKYKTTGNVNYLVGTPITDYTIVEGIVDDINRESSANIQLKVPSNYYWYLNNASEEYSRRFNKSYYYHELNENDLESLGIKQEEDTFIVNYITGEVINNNLRVTRTGKPLYIYSVKLENISLP